MTSLTRALRNEYSPVALKAQFFFVHGKMTTTKLKVVAKELTSLNSTISLEQTAHKFKLSFNKNPAHSLPPSILFSTLQQIQISPGDILSLESIKAGFHIYLNNQATLKLISLPSNIIISPNNIQITITPLNLKKSILFISGIPPNTDEFIRNFMSALGRNPFILSSLLKIILIFVMEKLKLYLNQFTITPTN